MSSGSFCEQARAGVWVYPMNYPLKVIGDSAHPMQTIVAGILSRHIDDFDAATLSCRHSAGGKYVSVSATFILRSEAQRDQLYAELAACPQIKLVL